MYIQSTFTPTMFTLMFLNMIYFIQFKYGLFKEFLGLKIFFSCYTVLKLKVYIFILTICSIDYPYKSIWKNFYWNFYEK